MKIMYFTGGLGNQMFEFAFYFYMKKKFPRDKFYGLYNKKKLSEHHGLEINKWFDVQMPRSTWYSNMTAYAIYVLRNVFKFSRWYDSDRYVWSNKKAFMFNAFKYTKEYFPEGNNWLRFKIDCGLFEEENKTAIDAIDNTESVFIHVRRGDYLSPKFKDTFADICTPEYYQHSIEIIKEKMYNPRFFVFSDDIDWCRENLKVDNATFIYWNTGVNSPIDMFLMSRCKGAIIANSTFSYWGAYLGHRHKIVVYPKKWINGQKTPNIFMANWIGI